MCKQKKKSSYTRVHSADEREKSVIELSSLWVAGEKLLTLQYIDERSREMRFSSDESVASLSCFIWELQCPTSCLSMAICVCPFPSV